MRFATARSLNAPETVRETRVTLSRFVPIYVRTLSEVTGAVRQVLTKCVPPVSSDSDV